MIQISVLYPNDEGSKFDFSYYCEKHMPLVKRLLGSALKGIAVEQGISGQPAGSKPPYLALGHLRFESVEAYEASFGPHAHEIVGDIPNYTNTQPIIQVSQIRL